METVSAHGMGCTASTSLLIYLLLSSFVTLSALHMATANGHLDIVEYLIKNGADLNACNLEKNTPLHWACLNGHSEVVRVLIVGGADATILNSHERTPMDEAVSRGKMEVVDAINTAVAQVELDGSSVS